MADSFEGAVLLGREVADHSVAQQVPGYKGETSGRRESYRDDVTTYFLRGTQRNPP